MYAIPIEVATDIKGAQITSTTTEKTARYRRQGKVLRVGSKVIALQTQKY
jgi:hypothetical protein